MDGELMWRPAARGDLEAVTAVVQASERHDRRLEVTPAEIVARDLLGDPEIDLSADTLVVERGGEVVAFGLCYCPRRPGPTHHFAVLYPSVHPAARTAVGDQLVERLAARGTALLSDQRHDRQRMLRADVMAWQDEDRHRYAALGFSETRWFAIMSCPDPGCAPAPFATAGVALLPWSDDRQADTQRAHAAAFLDHWGHVPLSDYEWRARTVESPNFRRDLSWLAMAGNEVVGYLLCDHYPGDTAVTGRREAWLSTVGVVPGWRKRGLASNLLASCLASVAADPQLDTVGLDVDAASQTGANRLYERLGFRVVARSVTLTRVVQPGTAHQ